MLISKSEKTVKKRMGKTIRFETYRRLIGKLFLSQDTRKIDSLQGEVILGLLLPVKLVIMYINIQIFGLHLISPFRDNLELDNVPFDLARRDVEFSDAKTFQNLTVSSAAAEHTVWPSGLSAK